METIPKSDCEKIGFIRKTHGIHGEIMLEFEEQFEYSVEDTERFFIELEGLLVPFFITEEGLRFRSGKSAIVKLDWVDTETYAKRLVGKEVYLYKDEIVDMPEEHESVLMGFRLFDKETGEIGIIEEVDDYSGNIVLTVNFQGNELLIPYNDEILIDLNEEQKTITLQLPEGLIDS